MTTQNNRENTSEKVRGNRVSRVVLNPAEFPSYEAYVKAFIEHNPPTETQKEFMRSLYAVVEPE